MEYKDATIDKIDEDLNLLIRHLRMLRVAKENQPIGIIRLSEMTDIPKHKIRYSLRLLEKDGVIEPTPEGARVTDMYDGYLRRIRDYATRLRSTADTIDFMSSEALDQNA